MLFLPEESGLEAYMKYLKKSMSLILMNFMLKTITLKNGPGLPKKPE